MRISALSPGAARFLGILAAGLVAAAAPPSAAKALTNQDAQTIIDAVVGVEAEVPADARSADLLGQERAGTGVVIDGNGLVLTVGYLILDADKVAVIGPDGRSIPAAVVGYDHATGFGLVRAVLPLDVKPVALGHSADVKVGDAVLAMTRTGSPPLMAQQVVSRRPFAGYWEYLLNDAVFTSPPLPGFGGAALIDAKGTLVGIGSLVVGNAVPGPHPVPGNMFIPIDLLKPILGDLLADGRRSGPAQPWLGLYTGEAGGHVVVARVVAGGPAAAAGIRPGDIILAVGGKSVHDLVGFMRQVLAQGPAGTDIRVDVVSTTAADIAIDHRVIHSRARRDWLKQSDNGL